MDANQRTCRTKDTKNCEFDIDDPKNHTGIHVENRSVTDNRISKVSETLVEGGTATVVAENSPIFITGPTLHQMEIIPSKDPSQHSQGLCQEGASRNLNHYEDRSVTDNRQVTVGNVVIQGGHAEISFMNAPVMVNGKMQEHGIPLQVPNGDIDLTKMLETLNRDTWEESEVKITGNYEAEKLKEPPFVVHPQMEESPQFYKGGFSEGHAEMSFMNSPVKVPNGDICLTKILEKVNRVTWLENEVKITSSRPIKAVKLKEPPFVVHPQMEESPQFYKGGYSEIDDIPEEMQGTSRQFMAGPRTKQATYKKPHMFGDWIPVKAKPVSYDLFKKFVLDKKGVEPGKRLGILGLVAPAGAGKTTCLRRLARDTMRECGITPTRSYLASPESRFKVVFFIDLKDIPSENVTSLQEILLYGYFRGDQSKFAYDWLWDNQSECCFFIDGLDQAAWSVEQTEQTKVKQHTESSTGLIMYNLLSRKLLPQARIVIASREFKVATLPTQARPEKIITLKGFSDEDAEKLFKSLLPDAKIEHPWEKLKSQSSSLARFMYTPLFLMFTAVVSCSTAVSLPKNVSGLIAQMLELFEDSENIQEAKRIWTVLRGLKNLAHGGMDRNVVLFTAADLAKQDLSLPDVRDILLTVQKNRVLSQRVGEAHLILYFCHQSFQEFLSAMHIAEMEISIFKDFVDKQLHEDRWSVVRQFVFGIVYTLHGTHFQVSDRERKQTILSESIPCRLDSCKDFQRLELYAAMYEADDAALIQQHLRDIKLKGLSLGHSGSQLIGGMIGRSLRLNGVSLIGCSLNDQMLKGMADNVKYKKVDIESLNVTWSLSELMFSTVNTLLKHLVIRTLEINGSDASGEGGIDWTNVQRVFASGMAFINAGPTVKVTNLKGNITGVYVKEDKILQFTMNTDRPVTNVGIDSIVMAAKFFDAKSVNLIIEGERDKQYLKYTNLQKIGRWNIKAKVKKVVLDCDVDHELESSLMVSYVAQARVEHLAIKIRNDNHNAVPDHEALLHELSEIGCKTDLSLRNKVIQPGWKAIGNVHFLGARVRVGEKPSIAEMAKFKSSQ